MLRKYLKSVIYPLHVLNVNKKTNFFTNISRQSPIVPHFYICLFSSKNILLKDVNKNISTVLLNFRILLCFEPKHSFNYHFWCFRTFQRTSITSYIIIRSWFTVRSKERKYLPFYKNNIVTSNL